MKGDSDLDVAREAPRPRWADDHPPIRAAAAAGWAASEDPAQVDDGRDNPATADEEAGAASCPPAGPVLGSVHAQEAWFPLEGRQDASLETRYQKIELSFKSLTHALVSQKEINVWDPSHAFILELEWTPVAKPPPYHSLPELMSTTAAPTNLPHQHKNPLQPQNTHALLPKYSPATLREDWHLR
jgi:hypothetical protein